MHLNKNDLSYIFVICSIINVDQLLIFFTRVLWKSKMISGFCVITSDWSLYNKSNNFNETCWNKQNFSRNFFNIYIHLSKSDKICSKQSDWVLSDLHNTFRRNMLLRPCFNSNVNSFSVFCVVRMTTWRMDWTGFITFRSEYEKLQRKVNFIFLHKNFVEQTEGGGLSWSQSS